MWYVVQVMTGEEEHCLQFCRRQMKGKGYHEMFVPRYVQKKRYQGVWHEEKKVLFPGYIFIDTDAIEEVAKALQRIPRMTKLLRSGETVAPITDDEQKYLMSLMDEEHVVQISIGLIIGDEIWITEGALRNCRGQIKKIDRHRRLAELEVNLFGRMTPVQAGLEVIQKVTKEEFEEMKNISVTEFSDATENGSPSSEHQFVRIVSGIFAGMTGEFISENIRKKEVKVSLELFGKQTPVIFSQDEVCHR